MKVPIEQFFTRRIQAGLDDVDAAVEAARHGESPEWQDLSRNILEFVARIDPDMPQRSAMFFLVLTQAMVETLEAVAREVGVTSVDLVE